MRKPEPAPELAPEPAPDAAAARFWMLQLMRLGGLMMVMLGVVMIAGRLPAPPVLGYGLFLLGAVEFFFLPRLLAKRWKTPGE